MLRLLLVISAASAIAASAAQAGDKKLNYGNIAKDDRIEESDVNYNSMKAHGFDGVADLLEDMTPEQRREILDLAAERKQELEAMSPQERKALERQLRETAQMIEADVGFDNIDPAKLDAAKAKNTEGTMNDMGEFKKLREEKQNKR